jgi:hypothetical protein
LAVDDEDGVDEEVEVEDLSGVDVVVDFSEEDFSEVDFSEDGFSDDDAVAGAVALLSERLSVR